MLKYALDQANVCAWECSNERGSVNRISNYPICENRQSACYFCVFLLQLCKMKNRVEWKDECVIYEKWNFAKFLPATVSFALASLHYWISRLRIVTYAKRCTWSRKISKQNVNIQEIWINKWINLHKTSWCKCISKQIRISIKYVIKVDYEIICILSRKNINASWKFFRGKNFLHFVQSTLTRPAPYSYCAGKNDEKRENFVCKFMYFFFQKSKKPHTHASEYIKQKNKVRFKLKPKKSIILAKFCYKQKSY